MENWREELARVFLGDITECGWSIHSVCVCERVVRGETGKVVCKLVMKDLTRSLD